MRILPKIPGRRPALKLPARRPNSAENAKVLVVSVRHRSASELEEQRKHLQSLFVIVRSSNQS